MGQHDLPITATTPDQAVATGNEAGETIYISATYPAVPWACPESMTVNFDLLTTRNVTVQALERIVIALAGVPAMARATRDDPTLFDTREVGGER